jgi:hypothetical protein
VAASPFLAKCAGLYYNQQGAMAIMLGLLILPLIGVTGLAIDTLRLQSARQNLQISTDAALSVAVRTPNNPNEARSKARQFFDEAVRNNKLDIYELTDYRFTPLETAGTYKIEAQLRVPLILMGIFGENSRVVYAQSSNQADSKTLELAITIDTGMAMGALWHDSAAPNREITYLGATQEAVIDFLRALYPTGDPVPALYTAIIPFSSSINLGPAHGTWVLPQGGISYRDADKRSWGGCVMERKTDPGFDDPPQLQEASAFTRYLVPQDTPALNGSLAHRHIDGWPGLYGNSVNSGCGPQVLPLTNKPRQFWDKVTGLQPAVIRLDNKSQRPLNNKPSLGYGSSLPSEGLLWAWRSISPKWRSQWQGLPGHMPYDLNASHKKHILLFMSGVADLTDFDSALGRLTGNPQDNILSAQNSQQSDTLLRGRFERICQQLKAQRVGLSIVWLGPANRLKSIALKCVGQNNLFSPKDVAEMKAQISQLGRTLQRDAVMVETK